MSSHVGVGVSQSTYRGLCNRCNKRVKCIPVYDYDRHITMVTDEDISITQSLAKLAESQAYLGKMLMMSARNEAANIMHSASSTKANEYQQRRVEDKKIAKSYDLMSVLTGVGGQLRHNTYNDDISSGTDGLRYFSGSTQDKSMTMADKTRKSYELMRLFSK